MAEDASGILFLRRDAEVVKAQLSRWTTPYVIRAINDTWGAFFLRDDRYDTDEVKPLLETMSVATPLLYYLDTGDYGWEYSIYADGQEVAHASISYDLPYEDDRKPPEAYRAAVDAQYARRNLEEFRRFGLDDAHIDALSRAISPEFFLDAEDINDAQDQSVFIRTLDIEAFFAMTYRWLAATNQQSDL